MYTYIYDIYMHIGEMMWDSNTSEASWSHGGAPRRHCFQYEQGLKTGMIWGIPLFLKTSMLGYRISRTVAPIQGLP